jgi:hypothetical protein
VTSYASDWDQSSKYQVEVPAGTHSDSRYKDGQTTNLHSRAEDVYQAIRIVLPSHTTKGWKSLKDASAGFETLCNWKVEARTFTIRQFKIVLETITTGAVRANYGAPSLFDENYMRPPHKFICGYIQQAEDSGVTSIRTGRTKRKELLDMLRVMNLGPKTVPSHLIMLKEFSCRLADLIADNLQDGLHID